MTTAEPVSLSRADLDKRSRTKHGYCELEDGSRLYFVPLRRSRIYAIDTTMCDADGQLLEDQFPTRPARMLAGHLCDSDGERLYRDDEWPAVDALPSDVFDPAWRALRKHLGLNTDEDEAAEASDAAKN